MRTEASAQRMATSLGLVSIGLGLAQILAPRAMSRMTGLGDRPMLMRAIGIREIACGIGILTQPQHRSRWLWARAAGDAMDLTLLGSALVSPRNPARDRASIAAGAVLGVGALDTMAAQRFATVSRATAGRIPRVGHAVELEASMIVNRPPEECYRFWHDFENLPRFMRHLDSVQVVDEKRSHWTARMPTGGRVEWDSEVVSDVPNSLIAWRSVEGSQVPNSGWVRFEPAPAGRGTVVRVKMQYDPPGGVVGSLAAKLMRRGPQFQVREDLRRFKQVIETGEIPTTEGQPSGERGRLARPFLQRHADADRIGPRSEAYES